MVATNHQTRAALLALCAVLASSLSACTPRALGVRTQVVAPGEAPVQIGTPVRDNLTPMEASLACFSGVLAQSGRQPLIVGVGDIKDYTGRYSINEGNVVTQGGSLMLFSALGKLGGTVRIAERFDPSIAERELGYMDRRQLGNGEAQEVNGQRVPWMPYYGGTIQASDFYIAGGITEVNYNISSGGAEASVNNMGAKARTYTQSVAIDLRIVDTRTLLVADAISLSKQFSGYEVGANTFRFFGLGLVDINIGAKGQEPLQLGIRAAIEEAAIRLIGRVAGLDPEPCLKLRTREIQERSSEDQFAEMVAAMPRTKRPVQRQAPPRAPAGSPRPAASLNAVQSSGAMQSGEVIQVSFELGDANLSGPSQAVVDRIAVARQQGSVNIVLVTRETENLDPGQRSRLLDQRLTNLMTALANRGVPEGAVSVVWRPERSDATIFRDGPGLQIIARIKITK